MKTGNEIRRAPASGYRIEGKGPRLARPFRRHTPSVAATILVVLAALAAPRAASSASERHSATKLVGAVASVDPTHLTLRAEDGHEVTLAASEDYTQRLVPGAKVTAWVFSEGGANTLERLDAPRDAFFVPAEEIRQRVRKVVILPESSVPGADALFDAMHNYLESRAHWYVAAPRLVGDVLRAALKSEATQAASPSPSPARPLSSTLAAIDPETGDFDIAAYAGKPAPQPAKTVITGAAKPPSATSVSPPSSTLDAINPATGEFDMARYTQGEPAKQDQAGATAASPAQTAAAAPAASALDAIDPATGNFDMARYLQSKASTPAAASNAALTRPTDDPRFVARVASLIRVDAVLEAEVIRVQAPVSRLVARWDGAEEAMASKGSETVAHLTLAPRHGTVPATTVILKLWDSQGNLLWTNRTGFAVLAVREGLRNEVRPRPLAEVLSNHATLDQWLNGVFTPLLSGPASSSGTSRKR